MPAPQWPSQRMSQSAGLPYGLVLALETTEDRGREYKVLGRLDVSTIWKAVTSVSVFVWCSSLVAGRVEGEERDREARAKRCRF